MGLQRTVTCSWKKSSNALKYVFFMARLLPLTDAFNPCMFSGIVMLIPKTCLFVLLRGWFKQCFTLNVSFLTMYTTSWAASKKMVSLLVLTVCSLFFVLYQCSSPAPLRNLYPWYSHAVVNNRSPGHIHSRLFRRVDPYGAATRVYLGIKTQHRTRVYVLCSLFSCLGFEMRAWTMFC